MVTEKIKQLQALQAKAKELQDSIDSERTQELATLPSRYGYDSLAGFINALKDANAAKPARRGRKPGKARAAKPVAAKSGGKKKRKRAKITAETKAQVKSAVEAGKTGGQIAKELGISLPSVQNIKKELGLVKARGGKS